MALEQNATWTESVEEESTQRDRLCTAVQFLLNCFGSMHHLKMAKSICFVLEDVGTLLLGMNSTTRMEAFSELPSITMDDLGFLKKKASTRLDLAIVTKDELLLLFVVCHLSLKGKSHLDEVVKSLKNLAPQVISMILSCESTSRQLDYLSKYPQYFQSDSKGYLKLDSTFVLPFGDASNANVSFQTDKFLQYEGNTTLPNSDSQGRFLSRVSKLSNPETENENEISEISIKKPASPGVPLQRYISQNRETKVINKIESANSANMRKIHSRAKSNEVSEDGDNSLPDTILSHVSLEKTASETKTIVYRSTPNTVLKLADRICTMVREGIVFLFEHFKCQIDLHLVCVVLHALHEAKRLFLWLLQTEQIALVEKILEPLWVDGVEDHSGTFLKHSSETFKLNEEQKNLLFISCAVGQSEKLHCSALLGMFEKHKMDLTELKQIEIYFKYKRDFFSINEAGYIKFENFPPAKWMAERFSSMSPFPCDSSSTCIVQSGTSQVANDIAKSFEDLSLDRTIMSKNAVGEGYAKERAKETIKEMQTKSVSGYPQDTLDYLSVILHDGIAYLLQFFKLNVKWRLLELVLHVAKDCALFLVLSSEQQLEVIRASYHDFHIDEHGRIFSISTTKQHEFRLSKSVRMILCMSHIISRKGIVQYLNVLSSYHEYTGETKHLKDSELFELLNKRKDIFLVSSDGDVSLVNVPTIKFNYTCIVMSDRSFNAETVAPRKKSSPKCTLTLETNCSSVLQSHVEKNGNGVSVAQNEKDNDETSTEEDKSISILDSLSQYENVLAVRQSNDEARTLTGTNEDKVAKRVKDGISYLSQSFGLEVDDLTFVFYVLQDVRGYLLNLALQARDEFVKKCVSHLVVSSEGSISSTAFILDSCTLNDEEKIALYITLLLSREKELHYTRIFDKFLQNNVTKPACLKSVLDQYEFVTTRKNVFTVCPHTDFVKLLPILGKNSEGCLSDNASTDTNITNSSVDENDYFKFEIKGSIKHFLEMNSISQNNSTSIKPEHFTSALQFYNRIQESVTYLSKTFEVVSAEQIMKAIFYVLHGVCDLFSEELDDNKCILKKMHLSFRERSTTHLEMAFEQPRLNQEEKNLLAFVIILIQSRTVHFQELLNAFESHGGDLRWMTVEEHYVFLKKKRKCFAVDGKGNVSLNENHASALILDDFFKDLNSKSTFETAALKGSDKNTFTLAEDHSRNCKSSSGSIQRDVLYGINDICNDVLSLCKQTRCNAKSLHDNTDNPSSDVLSTIKTEPITDSTISTGATENKATRDDDSSLPKNHAFNHLALEKTAFETKNGVHPITVKTTVQMADRICTVAREGMVFLFEHFKCRLDLHLICVVLHALYEARCAFLLLSQSEQMALVEKILAPLWIAGVEDNSGTFLRPSSETFGLNKEQVNLLFISYVVGQSEKLDYSSLLEKFKKHSMDITELKQIEDYFKCKGDFFSVDAAKCIKFENFPPSQWMAEHLSYGTPFPPNSYNNSVFLSGTSQIANVNSLSFGDLSLDQTRISKTVPTHKNAEGVSGDQTKDGQGSIEGMQPKHISEYSQDTLDYLSARIFDGIAYLLQFFELNVYAGLLEVVLHVASNCAKFFGMSSKHQMEIIRASFRAFHIDGHGRVFPTAATKLNKFVSTEKVRMLLCIAFIVNRKGIAYYQEVFSVYRAYVGQTKQSKDLRQFEYFKQREDIFFVSSDGYVRLVNVSTIKFNYISILMSERIPNPMFLNTGAVIPRMNPPIIFNPGAVFPRINFTPLIFNPNAFMPRMICNPITFSLGAGMPRMNFGPMNFNTSAVIPRMNFGPSFFNRSTLIPETNCSPFISNCVEKNGEEISLAQNDVAATMEKTCTEGGESLAVVDLSVVQHSKDTTRTLTETDEEEEAKRVKEGISYLSQSFVLEADDLTLIFCVLEDVKSYLLKLALQARDDFVNKCVSHLVVSSRGSVSSTPAITDSCTLNNEEKIALYIALLLSREKELHYTQIFDKYKAINSACEKNVVDQYEFVTKWKQVFSMSLNGNVRLLTILAKNSDVCSGDNVSLNTNETNLSLIRNDYFIFESKDSIKRFLEINSTHQNNSTGIKCKHLKSALLHYNRIKESIVYLSKTFESVSAEHIIKAIFYVLHDVRVLFVKKFDMNTSILKAMHLSFINRKTTRFQIDKLTFELLNLDQDEKNVLALICILIESPTMRYQELFNVFQSHCEDIQSMTSAELYLYLKKKKRYFLTEDEEVSLIENYRLSSFNLDDFFKDVNLKTSFQSAVLEGSDRNAVVVAEVPHRKWKSSSGCIQNDVLCAIHDICNDVLSYYKQMRCNSKSLRKETSNQASDVLSTIKTEPSTESAISIGATKTKHDFVSNETNFIDIKPTDVSTEHAIKDNRMIGIDGNESSIVSEFHKSNKVDVSEHSTSTESIKEYQKNFSFMHSVKPLSFTSKDIPIDIPNQTNASQVGLQFNDQSRRQSRSDCSAVCQGESDSNILIDSSVAPPCIYRKASDSAEDCDKATNSNTAPIFNLLELLSDDESPAASSGTIESIANPSIVSDCGCTKDSTKERRTTNFFIIILGQSKIGFSVPVLGKKLLLASSEVQHYISCVYEDNILNFLQNHDNFYISPASGHICLKK